MKKEKTHGAEISYDLTVGNIVRALYTLHRANRIDEDFLEVANELLIRVIKKAEGQEKVDTSTYLNSLGYRLEDYQNENTIDFGIGRYESFIFHSDFYKQHGQGILIEPDSPFFYPAMGIKMATLPSASIPKFLNHQQKTAEKHESEFVENTQSMLKDLHWLLGEGTVSDVAEWLQKASGDGLPAPDNKKSVAVNHEVIIDSLVANSVIPQELRESFITLLSPYTPSISKILWSDSLWKLFYVIESFMVSGLLRFKNKTHREVKKYIALNFTAKGKDIDVFRLTGSIKSATSQTQGGSRDKLLEKINAVYHNLGLDLSKNSN